MSDDHLDDKFCTISPLHHQPCPPKVSDVLPSLMHLNLPSKIHSNIHFMP